MLLVSRPTDLTSRGRAQGACSGVEGTATLGTRMTLESIASQSRNGKGEPMVNTQ